MFRSFSKSVKDAAHPETGRTAPTFTQFFLSGRTYKALRKRQDAKPFAFVPSSLTAFLQAMRVNLILLILIIYKSGGFVQTLSNPLSKTFQKSLFFLCLQDLADKHPVRLPIPMLIYGK